MLFSTNFLKTIIYPQYVKLETTVISLILLITFNTTNFLYVWNAFHYADQYWFLYTNKFSVISQPTLLLSK